MPKYWLEIATNAQAEAAEWAALARECMDGTRHISHWRAYQTKAEALYSRARWAMSSDDCP